MAQPYTRQTWIDDNATYPASAARMTVIEQALEDAYPDFASTLPASPVDGQEAHLQVDATNGIVWTFRYRSGSASAYKWEFIGGAPAHAEVDTNQTTGAAPYVDLATVGPSITIPRAGEYLLSYGVAAWYSSGGPGLAHMYASPRIGAVAAANVDAVRASNQTAIAEQDNYARTRKKTIAVGDLVKLQYGTDGAGVTANFQDRWLSILPIRVS